MSGAVNRCSHAAKRELRSRWYCTRHYNIRARENRIDEWMQRDDVRCEDHPERSLRILVRDRAVYCSAKTGEMETMAAGPRGRINELVQVRLPTFCTWRQEVPPEIWAMPKT